MDEMPSAMTICTALMVFIIGIIIFMTVGKMEGDPATLRNQLFNWQKSLFVSAPVAIIKYGSQP